MSIWFKNYELAGVKAVNEVNMLAHLGISIDEIGDDFLVASMPVDDRTRQPFGVLHGGASCVLAESLGSIAANLVLDQERQYAVGLEINANHLRSVRDGKVQAVTRPVHLGRSTQVWEIRISDERDKLAVISRLTMAVLDR